ncbi:MAG: glycosyltransferase [Armatimonadota bacterium]
MRARSTAEHRTRAIPLRVERRPRGRAGSRLPGGTGEAPLRVGVFVNLALTPEAGGHVKCWERFAEAACDLEGRLDLSVHFLRDRPECRRLGANARFFLHPPVFSSRRLWFLQGAPDHSDLAPRHPGLQEYLPDYDVLHTAETTFAFADTVRDYACRHQAPLVTSTHTAIPRYTRIFAERALRNLFGETMLPRLLVERLRLPDRLARRLERRMQHYFRLCVRVLASSDEDYARALEVLPPERIGRLRRGVDLNRFHPRFRSRALLEDRYQVPRGAFVLLYVGRVDESKSPLVLARATRILRARGLPVYTLFAGRGGQREEVAAALGPHGACVGPVPQEALPPVYASADLFVLPSTTEVNPNVVNEARAAGLPTVLSTEGGSARAVSRPGVDGLLVESSDPEAWAAELEALLQVPERLDLMRRAARREAERRLPTWRRVLEEDLLAAWEAVTPARAVPARRRAAA